MGGDTWLRQSPRRSDEQLEVRPLGQGAFSGDRNLASDMAACHGAAASGAASNIASVSRSATGRVAGVCTVAAGSRIAGSAGTSPGAPGDDLGRPAWQRCHAGVDLCLVFFAQPPLSMAK